MDMIRIEDTLDLIDFTHCFILLMRNFLHLYYIATSNFTSYECEQLTAQGYELWLGGEMTAEHSKFFVALCSVSHL